MLKRNAMTVVPLDKNESYWLLDEKLMNYARAFERDALAIYPSYDELRTAIAAYAGVRPDMVLATPGSDAAIEHIARLYGGAGSAVLPIPTFYGYETILDRAGVKVQPVPYDWDDDGFVFPLRGTIETLAGASVIFLCQPNNPLGCAITDEDIAAVVDAVRGTDTMLVIDEAYFEFSGRTALPLLETAPNLVILRTFSKGFGIAGARVGYVIAEPALIAALNSRLLMSPIAHTSMVAALTLLAHADEVHARRALVITERERFSKALAAIPSVTVYPSETNFLLVRVPDARAARDALLAEGVRVALGEPMTRFPDAKRLLADTLRIAVPSPEDRPSVETVFTDLFQK